VFLALGAQHSLLMLHYHFSFFASLFITALLMYLLLRLYMLAFAITFSQLVLADGTPRSGLLSFAVK